ncbi:Endonuclease/exonuclease/phosphatase [Pseudocohnilembus persalinus]|uniref:Endonuclease/exonuclease/phosphatase n=1 Tax=Pseudocohnilembus persalinus TaxID=266149 RepID=A0A0V0QXA0_PSEPJ|nr:Endonuclease/exonuclease/phosphatase [Pseudocohnilembus persalinus]|eukprot:KRX07033.1 Endonuclease/exonuclease/phosphatase [Pseudocohnilembus persalinus]
MLTVYYSQEEQEWVIYDQDITLLNQEISQLTTLTYNVWYESHRMNERHQELRKIISSLNPDIICLQEATEMFQNYLYQDKQIRQNYFISGYKIHGYGCLLLSKFPLKFELLQFTESQNRSLIYGVTNVNGQQFCVATTHLESGQDQINKEKRQQQMNLIVNELNKYKNVVLMGDFNFDNADEFKLLNSQGNFSDLFYEIPQTERESVQFTHKNQKNGNGELWRPDKILIKNYKKSNWKILSMRLVGTDDLRSQTQDQQEINKPSDHFGIKCELKYEN